MVTQTSCQESVLRKGSVRFSAISSRIYSMHRQNCSQRYLVEKKDVDLNVRDKWDGTPLYYACLCGHYDIVLYLLENGARCDANTFDGERCLYGALTRKIKNLLQNLKVVTSTIMRRDNYCEFFRRAFESSELYDVCFDVQGEKLNAHSAILAARNEHFLNLFKIKGKQQNEEELVISMDEFSVSSAAFKTLLQYVYTDRVDLSVKDADTFLSFAKCYGFKRLVFEVEENLKKRKKATTLSVERHFLSSSFRNDFHKLFLSTLPQEFTKETSFDGTEFVDIKFSVSGLIFSCHKVFVCGRCDYLKAMLCDHFCEMQRDEFNIQTVKLEGITPVVFMFILEYIYTNRVWLPTKIALDVLPSADLFILPGLKKVCGVVIGEHLNDYDVVEMTQIARMYNLPRLEAQCTEYMAVHLEEVISQESFKRLVISDANEIKERQETDTITIIDDIRYHIQSSTNVCNSGEKLLLIENLLESLKLDA